MNRFALKAATEDVHRDLDERLSRLDLATGADYRRFLSFQARTVPAIEAALAEAGIGALVEGWGARRRSQAIAADLRALGHTMPEPARIKVPSDAAAMLGTAYVLEGSRLGGRVLRRRVGEGLPASFLSESGHNSWPHVVAALDRHLSSDADVAAAGLAARQTFGFFLDAAREAGL